MAKRQTIKGPGVPRLILLTDARNDAALAGAIARLPPGSAVVFRHYHLPPQTRRRRFEALQRLARARGVLVIGAAVPRGWRCDGVYGAAQAIARRAGRAGRAGLRLATAHSLAQIADAVRAGADAVLLSPVHATRSHPGGRVLGPVRFLHLARQSPVPVIALGGMNRRRAARLPVHGWAAIDGLV